MNYNEAIDYLQSFPDSERGLSGTKPTRHLKTPLSTMQLFLTSLDNPQNSAKTIHITGSKGKGSTATFITHILHQAGFRTALFTSPHLHSYAERFSFNLEPISESDFAAGITELQPFIQKFDEQGYSLSTFSLLTALFFHLVRKSQPRIDWQIVEVGLGGKDDATNVFAQKEAAVITAISLEHTAILGETRQAIATNKAGIITSGCLTILAHQEDASVVETIKDICTTKKSSLLIVPAINQTDQAKKSDSRKTNSSEIDFLGTDFSETDSSETNFFSQKEKDLLCSTKLLGDHQIDNAATALTLATTLRKKGYNISETAIKSGLATAFLPGRFEIFSVNNFAAANNSATSNNYASSSNSFAPSTNTIVLDGAHNGDSAAALAKTLKSVFPDKKIVFILGLNQDKNLEDIWFALKDLALAVIATRSDTYRAMTPETIKERILACDPKAHISCAENTEAALAQAISSQEKNIICLCGSLYLVAEARARLIENQPAHKI